jgi:hypothetical protein
MGFRDQPGFRRNRHGHVSLHLPESERAILRDLFGQMASMLTPEPSAVAMDPLAELVGIDPLAVRPADPALARLFPDAYTDAIESDEFRRFTMRDLRSGKLANTTATIQSLSRPDPTRLSKGECQAWLGSLNDLRLTMGTRLAVSEDGSQGFNDLPDDDPNRAMALVYDWLTFHQERLIRALEKGVVD